MLKLFSGSAAIRIFGAAAQLLLTLAVSRICGPTQAGIYFFGYSLLMIISTGTRLGSEFSGLRKVSPLIESGQFRELKQVVDSRMALTLSFGLLAGLIMASLTPQLARHTYGDNATSALFLTAGTIPAMAMIGQISELLKGAQHAWLALSIQNIALPFIAVPAILLATSLLSPSATVVSAIIFGTSWLVIAAGTFAWFRIFKQRFDVAWGLPTPQRVEILQIFRDAPSLVVVSMMSTIMQWSGAALLGFLAPPSAVAGYSVAMRISIAVSIVHSAASSVVGPQMAVAHATGKTSHLRQICHLTGVLIAGITWPALLLMFTFAAFCLSIFGNGYMEYSHVLRILLLGQLLAALIGHSGMVLVMTGEYASARLTSVSAGLTLAIIGTIAIPLLGAAGAALAMAGSVAIGHLTGLALVRRHLNFWTVPMSLRDARELHRRQRPQFQGAVNDGHE